MGLGAVFPVPRRAKYVVITKSADGCAIVNELEALSLIYLGD